MRRPVSSRRTQFGSDALPFCATVFIVGQESGRRPKFDPDQRDARAASDEQDEHRSFNVTVGEAIRRSRQEHGWTQAFLAEQAGLSPNYIARLERGELGPSLFVANRICGALAIDLEVLVTPSSGATPARKTSTRRRILAG
jgi:ribosome-binding protein aMBF1 (putative translation factor)